MVNGVQGIRVNSPNDLVVAGDGVIWFTDRPYGILKDGEGHPGELEYGACWVFRFVPETGELTPVITDLDRPNGIAFPPDESVLYVANSADYDGFKVWAYDVVDGQCGPGRLFYTGLKGVIDGFRVDTCSGSPTTTRSPSPIPRGRCWAPSTARSGWPTSASHRTVTCTSQHGHLYIAATTTLYRIQTYSADAALS